MCFSHTSLQTCHVCMGFYMSSTEGPNTWKGFRPLNNPPALRTWNVWDAWGWVTSPGILVPRPLESPEDLPRLATSVASADFVEEKLAGRHPPQSPLLLGRILDWL